MPGTALSVLQGLNEGTYVKCTELGVGVPLVGSRYYDGIIPNMHLPTRSVSCRGHDEVGEEEGGGKGMSNA